MLSENVVAIPSIGTLDDLREHLQWAIELEHTTLPPYLCALYSLDPTRNADAATTLVGVFVEEMLHLALAANILNAVGGRPCIDTPALLRPYPRPLPQSDSSLELSLAPFDAEALAMFLRVELPAPATAVPEVEGYQTIGQFYTAIEDGLRGLCDELGEGTVFSGDPARQVRDATFSHSAAELVVVDGLSSALRAVREIVDQGEGTGNGEIWDGDTDVFHPDRAEAAHYFRFQELKLGRRYQRGDTTDSGPTGEAVSFDPDFVYPMRRNPRLVDHPVGHPIRVAQEQFNATYCGLLGQLDEAFNGSPAVLTRATRVMFALKAQAVRLLQLPDADDCVAGPTFDYVAPELRG